MSQTQTSSSPSVRILPSASTSTSPSQPPRIEPHSNFDRATADRLDQTDPLHHLRSEFSLPAPVYLCGHSLGARPNAVVEAVQTHLEKWGSRAVNGHFEEPQPWVCMEQEPARLLMPLVGARYEHEVAVMNALTVNLHAMLTAFYRPHKWRTKILMEAHAFPSDMYAVHTHIASRGLDPNENVVIVEPRAGESLLREQDLWECIDTNAQSLALILLPGVQYFTGQVLPMKALATRARAHGIPFGLDLAHAVGNMELHLHDWQVDFAVWCSYKYLNSGPGATGALFLHDKHADEPLARHAGWWGHCPQTRFEMRQQFQAQRGAPGFQASNVPVLAVAPLIASLQVFERAGGVAALRKKSILLTHFLQVGLQRCLPNVVTIVSPLEAERRGCQLSLRLRVKACAQEVCEMLEKNGVVCDFRRPDVLRVAPVPLYNRFADVYVFVRALEATLAQLAAATAE